MAALSLPVREPPLAGESLTGHVRRHVMAMGYDGFGRLMSLIDNVEFPQHLDHLRRGAPLAALASVLQRDAQSLLQMTAHTWTEQLRFRRRSDPAGTECDSKTLLRYFDAAHRRICRQCLAESPLLERLIWSFRPLPICIEHAEVLLDRCPGCQRPFLPRRLDLSRCRCGYWLTVAPTLAIFGEVLDTARAIGSWLADAQPPSGGLPAHAAFWWMDRLRSALARTPIWLGRIRSDWKAPEPMSDDSLSWLAAASLIRSCPAHFAEFLATYQEISKHGSTSTGVGRSFGLLLRDADRLERFGFPGPAEMLRGHLLEQYTGGHLSGKVILFRSARHRRQLEARPWLTQTAAARRLGVRPPTIGDLIRRGVLTGKVQPAGRRGRTVGVVARTSVEKFRERMAAAISVREAAAQLGVERHRVLELIDVGILGDAVRTARGWQLSQATIDASLAGVRRLAPLPASRENWISLREATRRFGASGLNLVRIVQEVFAGRLVARRHSDRPTLRHLFIDRVALQLRSQTLATETSATVGYSLNRLATVLVPSQPLKDIVLRKWIRAGLLTATRRQKAWRVTPDEVARFRTTYCLAREACALLGVTRSTLARWQREGKITPIYARRSHPGAGASVFHRRDIERLAGQRAA